MKLKLFYTIIGATPPGRHVEQHDVFFGIAPTVRDLIPALEHFWPEAKGEMHLDGYQEVQFADGYTVEVVEKTNAVAEQHLFFINLGGYTPGVFQEFHEQLLLVDTTMANVIKRVKQTEFYKTMGFPGATSHVDDKYGVDIDDIYKVEDLLPADMKEKYSLKLTRTDGEPMQNITKIGYLKFTKL